MPVSRTSRRGRPTGRRDRFDGMIAGLGTGIGLRIVVGCWTRSRFGEFSDVMLERADGQRILAAPTQEIADYVRATYVFDEVRLVPVRVRVASTGWQVQAGALDLCLTIGSRLPLGWVLRTVPAPVAASPAWAALVDPVARVALRGVRTRGIARAGRREWYGATDVRRILAASGTFDGEPLGGLRDVDPATRFGFSSTPRTPCVTTVVSTVES